MTTEIFDNFPGRNIASYDLLDDIQETHGLSTREAHEAIHAMLDNIVNLDGDSVILDRRPARPELLEHNPNDLDVRYWLTISDENAETIRDAIAAQHATA